MAFNILAGAQYVQQQGEDGRQRGEGQFINKLLGEAYNAPDAAARKSALARLAGGGQAPAAMAAGQQFQKQDAQMTEDAFKRLQTHAKMIRSVPAEGRAAAWAQIQPRIAQELPEYAQYLPSQWDEAAVMPVVEQLASMGDGRGAQSARAAGFDQLTAGLSADQREKARLIELGIDPRAVAPGYSVQEVPNADGSVSFLQVPTKGVAPGSAIPVSVGGQMPPQSAPRPSLAASGGDPQMDALAQAANAMIKAGIPQEQVDAFLMSTAQASPNVQVNPPSMTPAANLAPAPMPAPANMVGGGPLPPLPGSGRGPMGFGQTDADRARAKASEAAQVEAAKIAAQQAAAPRQAQIDADREAAVVGARQGATNQAERESVQRTNNTAFAQYTAARDTLLSDLAGTATGPLAGRMPAMTERQQIAEGAQARMAPILKGLFRTAGEGTFTDKDQALLMAMVPTRTDLPGAVKAKMAGIDAIIEAKLQQGGGQPASAPPVEGARQAPDGNWYVQKNGQYFKVEQ